MLKTLLAIIVTLAIAGVLALGYLGFIPRLSALMGTNKPRDLGMAVSEEKYESGLAKSKVEMKELSKSSTVSLKYEGSHDVKANFSDDELTAHAYNRNWADYPLGDLQVRINDDNTCEISGILKLTKVDGLLNALNISQSDYKKALEKANIPLADVTFYAKGFGTASNNTFDATLTNFEVGRFPIPKGLIDKYQDQIDQLGATVAKSIPGFYVKEARFENGSIYFDGSLPDKEFTKSD